MDAAGVVSSRGRKIGLLSSLLTITTEATMTRVNFSSNIPSARYCAGLVIQSVLIKPLNTWNATEIQM